MTATHCFSIAGAIALCLAKVEARRPMIKLAFLGLGRMGAPMAGHLARAGHDVTVFNRTAAKAQQWLKTNRGRAVAAVKDAVNEAQIVFACLGDDPDIRTVANEALPAMATGTIFVDHTTTSASLSRELAAEAAKRGLHFVDAPVSGRASRAQQGQLTVMFGGDADASYRAEP